MNYVSQKNLTKLRKLQPINDVRYHRPAKTAKFLFITGYRRLVALQHRLMDNNNYNNVIIDRNGMDNKNTILQFAAISVDQLIS